MKKIRWLYVILCGIMALTWNGCSGSDNEETYPEPLYMPVPLADPFILLHEGKYYAYGTYSAEGILVLVSDNLETWTVPETFYPGGLALHKNDVWGDIFFWAPEVYKIGDTFYMYYSGDEHICVAASKSPLGPFRQEVEMPMITTEKAIDNSLFIDNGKPYLLYCRFNDGLNVWIAELEKDYITIKPGTERKCINVSQSWEEVWPRVNEGPFIVKHDNMYYMTYSANSYESRMYGVGCAVATDLTGPWIKYKHNPLLQSPRGLVGVGHSAMFMDKAGKLRVVFHAHYDFNTVHPRQMYISDVGFEQVDNEEQMVISDLYMSPKIEMKNN